MSRRGITLIELVVTMAISTIILFVAGHFLMSINTMFQRNLATINAEEDLLSVGRELERFYSRAMAVGFGQQGAGAAGYSVYKSGAILLNADLRPCGAFDPSSSVVVANQTKIGVVCCDANQVTPVNPPWGGSTTLTSVCVNSPGVSVELFANGGSVSRHCYPNIVEMSVMAMGYDALRKAPLYYHGFGISAAVALPDSPGMENSRQYLEFYRAVGNSGLQQSVPCLIPNLRF